MRIETLRLLYPLYALVSLHQVSPLRVFLCASLLLQDKWVVHKSLLHLPRLKIPIKAMRLANPAEKRTQRTREWTRRVAN